MQDLVFLCNKWKHQVCNRDPSIFSSKVVCKLWNIYHTRIKKILKKFCSFFLCCWCTELVRCFDGRTRYRCWEVKYYCLIVLKFLYEYKHLLVSILNLLMYQAWDTCVLVRFISHVCSKMKINKGRGCYSN